MRNKREYLGKVEELQILERKKDILTLLRDQTRDYILSVVSSLRTTNQKKSTRNLVFGTCKILKLDIL